MAERRRFIYATQTNTESVPDESNNRVFHLSPAANGSYSFRKDTLEEI